MDEQFFGAISHSLTAVIDKVEQVAEEIAPAQPVEAEKAPVDNVPASDIPTATVDPIESMVGASSPLHPASADAPAAEQPAEVAQSENKLKIAIRALKAIEHSLSNVITLLEAQEQQGAPAAEAAKVTADFGVDHLLKPLQSSGAAQETPEGRVVEGVFDGVRMVGADGETYSVPPNYASKSKLVEGDMLKLTISPRGSFIYKQIGPIERSRLVTLLGLDQTTGEFYVTEGERRWSVLKASITYFRGEPGDEVVLLLPKDLPSTWGAVENIIKKSPLA